MPSTSPLNPQQFIFTASPPAAPQVTALLSLVDSTINQWSHLLGSIQQDVIGEYQVFSQEIVQAVYAVQQQWGRFFGFNPNPTTAANGSDSGAGRGNGSGMGSGSGAATTSQNTSNQQLNNSTSQNGHGSGSGSTATSAQANGSGQGNIKMQPMARGSVPGGGVTSSSGYGSGAATVYGTVWLDSDYDGYIDNGELGYSGASVYLVSYDPTTGQYSVGQTPDITDSSGNYSFTVAASPTYPSYYGILVAFPWSFFCFASVESGRTLRSG